MNKIVTKIVKDVSLRDINIKKNYKIFRVLQKMLSSRFLNKNEFHDVEFDFDNRSVSGRVFKPKNKQDTKKIIIFIHGGGWVFGNVEYYTKTCFELCNKTGRTVISIDYRLAPEYPYPNGFNDCYDVINLVMNNLKRLGIKDKDVCLMGDSAGGNLVAAISLKAHSSKDFKVTKQILLYPALQCNYSNNTKYKSVIENGKKYILTQKQLQDYIDLYVTDKKDLKSCYVAPLNKKILFFQPKTLIITADKDPLRDEGGEYAKRLKLFFNKVTYYNIKGAYHGFFTSVTDKKNKTLAYEKIIEFLGDTDE